MGSDFGGTFTSMCLNAGTSSFADFLSSAAPGLLPGARLAAAGRAEGSRRPAGP